jgi:spore coat protein U-like protein
MKTKISKLALAMGALVMAGGVLADTSTMTSSATVAAGCSVGAGGAIALGALAMLTTDGTQTAADSTAGATFPAICTNGTTSPKFAYVSANGLTGSFRLKGGTTATEFITYTAHPSSNGSGTAVSGTAAAYTGFTANGVSQSLDLSAKILAADKATKSVQSYSDTITITVSFGTV